MSSMRLPARASLGVGSLLVASCAGSPEPAVTIMTVTPAAAYNDGKIALEIQGGPFRPAYDIDTTAGTAVQQLGAFTAFLTPDTPGQQEVAVDALMWISASQIEAVLLPGITAGPYDVIVRDPRGSLARLPRGFTSLGGDETAPRLSIVEPTPGTIVNPQAEVPVAFEADDGAGLLALLTWTVSLGGAQTLQGTCPLEPNAQKTTCRFNFVVPEPQVTPQTLTVIVSAVDDASNVGAAQTTLAIGLAPQVDDVSPVLGPATGGSVVTVTGANFISGTQVWVGDALLEPGGGTQIDAQTIRGTTPAHDPGSFAVTVQTGAKSVTAMQSFLFVGRPQVLVVSPTSGPPAGDAPLTIVGRNFRDRGQTKLYMGAIEAGKELPCAFVSVDRYQCTTSAGTGTVSIIADDPVSGSGELEEAYVYLDGDAGAPPDDGGPPLHEMTSSADGAADTTADLATDVVADAAIDLAAIDGGATAGDGGAE